MHDGALRTIKRIAIIMRIALIIAAVLFVAAPVQAADGIKTIESKYSVKQTLNRLTATLTKKGIRVIARVNHAAAAKAADMKLPPTELLIFGNPKLGTPLMQTERSIALDLPMKVLAWEDKDGTVKVSYTTPETLKARHNVSGRDEIFGKMSNALGALTAAAAGAK